MLLFGTVLGLGLRGTCHLVYEFGQMKMMFPAMKFILTTCIRVIDIHKCYFQAIDALKAATRSKPVASLFLLLGKTQMKARMWRDAVESFEKALEIVVSSRIIS